jgi:hypothetical protein
MSPPCLHVYHSSSSADPSCSFLRASLSAYMATLTLLCEARVAHMVHPVLDRVLELCDAATEVGWMVGWLVGGWSHETREQAEKCIHIIDHIHCEPQPSASLLMGRRWLKHSETLNTPTLLPPLPS